MLSKFAKYHGHGNDFIIIADLKPGISILALQNQARALCDRHIGIGADGILVLSTKPGYLDMTVINADGSLGLNCGNGLRCAARWYFEEYQKREIKIILGKKEYDCELEGELIRVSMGECLLESLDDLKLGELKLGVKAFKANLGNQHLIYVLAKPAVLDRQVYLSEAQKSFPAFEEYNIGFVFAKADSYESFVYERGVGWTNSCGSGACAAACALAFAQDAGHTREFRICQPGGDIMVTTRVLQFDGRPARFLVSQVGGAEGVFHGNLCQ